MVMYIKTSTINSWIIDKYFKERDLITIEDLIAKLEEVDSDLERANEDIQDIIEDRNENWKRKGIEEQI